MESIKNEKVWNKKKIIIVLFLVIALVAAGGYFLKTRFLDAKPSFPQNISKLVKGTSSVKGEDETQKESLDANVKKALQDKINGLRKEVSGLNILEVASSSPQVQKILQDIRSLEQYPETQAKEICKKICGL